MISTYGTPDNSIIASPAHVGTIVTRPGSRARRRRITRRQLQQRRGIALMLVMVALASATVITAAYLSSRQSAPNLSANVQRGLEARLNAETGVDLAAAIMQCDNIDWRTKQINGVLLDDYNFGGGTITINVADMNGDTPTESTEHVIVSSSGEAGEMKQLARAQMFSPRKTTAIDPDFSDFAIFANSSIRIGDSYLDRWFNSPNCQLGLPVKIGTNSTAASAVQFTGSTVLIDGVLYHREDASGSLVSNGCGNYAAVKDVDITTSQSIPMPDAPTPDTSNLANPDVAVRSVSSGTWWLTQSKWFTSLTVTGSAIVETDAPGHVMLVYGDMSIKSLGTMYIDKDIDIVVKGDVNVLSGGAIEVADGAHLRLWIGGALNVSNGALGLPQAQVDALRANSAAPVDFYSDPSLLMTYKLPGSAVNQTWKVDHNGWVCAQLYAPGNNVILDQSASLYGAVAANTVQLSGGSMVHYDPCLDSGLGYTNPESSLFASDKTLDNTLLGGLTSLTKSLIDSLSGADTDTATVTPPGDPTPRTFMVRKRFKQIGLRPHGGWYWRGFDLNQYVEHDD